MLDENDQVYRAKSLQRVDRRYTSEFHLCRRQILTSNVDPRAVKVQNNYNDRRPIT